LSYEADQMCSTTEHATKASYLKWDLLTQTSLHNRMSSISESQN